MTEDEKLAQLDFTDPQQMREALEHAKAAAAGSHDGIRLWMLDCGELVAKRRARADVAEKDAVLLSRAVHLIGAVARAPEGWEPPTAWHLEAVAFLAKCGETREVREYREVMAAAESAIRDELKSSREVEPDRLARAALEAAAPPTGREERKP